MNMMRWLVRKIAKCDFCYSPFHKGFIHDDEMLYWKFTKSRTAKIELIYMILFDVITMITSYKDWKLSHKIASESFIEAQKEYDIEMKKYR